MPLSNTTHGHGTQLFINLGAGLVRVAELDSFDELPGGFEQELYETSNFDSEGFKEHKKLPLKDGTPITVGGNYALGSASDTLLKAAANAEGALAYRVVAREGTKTAEFTGSALFYNYRRMNPADAKRRWEITMKPVTTVTETVA